MAISENLLTSSFSDIDTTSYSTASITPTADALILVAIVTTKNDGTDADQPTSVTGNGITYTLVDSRNYDVSGTHRQRLDVYRGMSSSPTSGAVTIDYGTNTEAACKWSIVEFTGVNTSGSNGSGAIRQSANNGNSSTTLTVTLPSSELSTSATYGAFGHGTSEATTSGTNFSIINDLGNAISPFDRLATEWFNGQDTTVDASWTTSDVNGGVAIEIAATPTASDIFVKLIEDD